ncbi:tyrosine-type recombinase/integrase [Dechloromonas sp. ZS-1]|uniref:tyrosine-type recombinase/integrase n=1 Tax=Dechloromonas sp. ZS-1 TaxID=3138067 RepID=UPI0031FC41C0
MARLAKPDQVKALETLDLGHFRDFLASSRFSANPYSTGTIDRYGRTAMYFVDFLKGAGIRDLEEVNASWVRSYLTGQKPDGTPRFSPSTRIVQQSALTALWCFAQDNGFALDNPLDKLAAERAADRMKLRGGRKPARLPKVLTWDQQADLLQVVLENPRADTSARDYLMVTLLLVTGLRKEELCSLKRADFHPGEGRLRVVGKGNKERLVRFDATEVLPAWEQYAPVRARGGDAPELLVTRTGKPLTGNLVYQQVSAYLAMLDGDLPAHGPHLLRHTSASRQLAMNVPITTVQANLGHAGLRTLEIYAHLLPPNGKKPTTAG